MPMSPG